MPAKVALMLAKQSTDTRLENIGAEPLAALTNIVHGRKLLQLDGTRRQCVRGRVVVRVVESSFARRTVFRRKVCCT